MNTGNMSRFLLTLTVFVISKVVGLNQTDTMPCKPPQAPTNGTVTVFGNNMLIEFRCDPGLFPVGRTFGSCNVVGGYWSIKRPLCVASTCNPPEVLTNGRYIFSHDGAIAAAVCDKRYQHFGSLTIYCDGSTWRGYTPSCREMYASTGEKRQAVPGTDPGTKDLAQEQAEQQKERDIQKADTSCYQRHVKPPDVDRGTVTIKYEYNKISRQWVLFAYYECEDDFKPANPYANYLYCSKYTWLSDVAPSCEEDKPPGEVCNLNNGGCEHICVAHRNGRYNCLCREGYVLGRYFKACDDINECDIDNGGCAHVCINIPGSYFCTCNRGYLISDGHKCLDVDECLTPGASNCLDTCINIPGSFECICNTSGYAQTRDKKSCIDVNECLEDNGGCEDRCTNIHGSYNCACTHRGYTLDTDGRTCRDIDECTRYGKLRCKHGQCENIPGSHICHCDHGYTVSPSGRKCLDINECKADNGGCAEECIDTPGSYHCGCHYDGYLLSADNVTCVDRDECEGSNGGCEEICINDIGSYKCACQGPRVLAGNGHNCTYCNVASFYDQPTGTCIPCPNNTRVSDTLRGTSIADCACMPGFTSEIHSSLSCVDVDECTKHILSCEHDCVNTAGSAYCACQTGYRLVNDSRCIDIDECSENISACSDTCMNSEGSFRCTCGPGSRLNQDGITCDDIDECYEGLVHCSDECVDVEGGAYCACPKGYRLQGDNSTCQDIDECIEDSHVCDHGCTNIPGGYTCFCNEPGYKLSWDRATCLDINECMEGDGQCADTCVNTDGSYTCTCHQEGFSLAADGFSCIDTDECAGETTCEQRCINMKGSYRCDCDPGYSLASFSKCAPCGWDTYRTLETDECVSCPPYSKTTDTARAQLGDCVCYQGYKRNPSNDTGSDHCVRI